MKFSVVIPTRNRASCLAHSITSALAQTFDDYEIVVSNNDSTDETEAVVRTLQTSRIRYYRTDKAMSMAAHWEFALGKATGQWVLYLCDDDALTPDCLARLDRLISTHPSISAFQYAAVTYVYDDGIAARGNYLKYRRPTANPVEVVSSRKRLEYNFRTMTGDMPKLLNAAVRMDLIERIRSEHGRLFLNWAPDYSAGLLLLAHTDEYVALHEPLLIWGKNLFSYGSGSQVDPRHLLRFLSEFEEFDGTLPLSPYPDLIVTCNCLYDTLHRVRDRLGAIKSDLEVNPCIFRRQLLKDIERYVHNGHGEFRRHGEVVGDDLRRTPWSSKCATVGTTVSTHLGRLYDTVRGHRARSRRIDGGDGGGFSNIAEAAGYYTRALRRA